ncbi:MAG: UMP kinase [Firmicutes bacterium]|jgi:uridylate kinase|nr:UMP kinase [Bacillota bacterium]
MIQRIILKLSGEALSGEQGFSLNLAEAKKVAAQVKEAKALGCQIGIVIGGGNFWRGRSSEGIDRVKADQIGMLATVMNCLYVSEVFRGEGMETSVYTPYPIGLYTEVFNKDKALRDLKEGKIVFFAGGTGHPFFSTDMGVALRAVEIEADLILMAKNVDGVYDSDPNLNPNAKKFESLTYQEMLAKTLRVIDLTAAAFLMDNHMPCKLFALSEEGSICRAIKGEKIGTDII